MSAARVSQRILSALLFLGGAGCGKGLLTDQSFALQPSSPGPPALTLTLAIKSAYQGYTAVTPFSDTFQSTGVPSSLNSPADAVQIASLTNSGNSTVQVWGSSIGASAHGRVDVFYDLSGIDTTPYHQVQVDVVAAGGTSSYSTFCSTSLLGGTGFEVNAYRYQNASPPWGTATNFTDNGTPTQGNHHVFTLLPIQTPFQDFISQQNPDSTSTKPYLHVSVQAQDTGDGASVCSMLLLLYINTQLTS